MTQSVSQLESKMSPLSSIFASFFKDLHEVFKVFTLEFEDLLEREHKTMRESIRFAVRGTNYKADKITENEARFETSVEEKENTVSIQEVSAISQNECISGLEEEKLQVYPKMFLIKDTSSNTEWKLEEVWDEIEKFLKEIFSKRLTRWKDFAFLFHELKRHLLFRGDILFGVALNYDGLRYRLISASQAKAFSILKVGLFLLLYLVFALLVMEQEEFVFTAPFLFFEFFCDCLKSRRSRPGESGFRIICNFNFC